jgi:uncharacterized protein
MTSREVSCAMGVMVKAPQPGRSKTRLCPPLLPEQAASLSAAFLRDATENMAAAAQLAPIATYAAYAPEGTEALIRQHLCRGTQLVLADGSGPMPAGVQGLGRCLLHATRAMLAKGHEAVCLLSSDSPTVPTRILVMAAELLLAPGERVVLGPTDDGGYYLLGIKAPHAALLSDIAWSTASVADQTRERAFSAGLPLVELEQWYDVDDAISLVTLLNDTRGYQALATRKAIEILDLRRLFPAAPLKETAA